MELALIVGELDLEDDFGIDWRRLSVDVSNRCAHEQEKRKSMRVSSHAERSSSH